MKSLFLASFLSLSLPMIMPVVPVSAQEAVIEFKDVDFEEGTLTAIIYCTQL